MTPDGRGFNGQTKPTMEQYSGSKRSAVFTDDQLAIRDLTRRFVRSEILPNILHRRWQLLTGLLIGCCYSTAVSVRERRFWPLAFIAAWLLIPILLSFAVSFVVPMLVSYYLILCVPALILFGVSGLSRIRWNPLVWVLGVPLLWLSVIQLMAFYQMTGHENWRDGTRYVLSEMLPNDGIAFYPRYVHLPFDYYVRQSQMADPTNLAEKPCRKGQRIWLVTRQGLSAADSAEIRNFQVSLGGEDCLVDQRVFHGVRIALYSNQCSDSSSGKIM
jgi:hypothetical protein